MSRHELTPEDRRRGGQARAEQRRKQKLRSWSDAYLEAVDADPAAFAQRLLSSSNGMVQVKALELAHAAQDAQVKVRVAELDEREKEAAEKERALATREATATWTTEWIERARQELEEVERARDELRSILEREAASAGMEVIEDED